MAEFSEKSPLYPYVSAGDLIGREFLGVQKRMKEGETFEQAYDEHFRKILEYFERTGQRMQVELIKQCREKMREFFIKRFPGDVKK